MTQTPYVSVRRLGYAYPRDLDAPVLQDVGLEVGRHDYLLLAGASGSGKSTLCRTFNGLIPHFHGGALTGEVVVDGRLVAHQSVAELFDKVGMVFQNPEAQLFHRSVRRELAFGLESQGLARPEIEQRVEDTVKRLGLVPLLDREPQALSGGEKQLVALASVLALRPPVVVLDEPFSSLDEANAARLRRCVREAHDGGTGVVLCEHRPAPAGEDARRIAVLEGGRVVKDALLASLTPGERCRWGLGGELPRGVGPAEAALPEPAALHAAPGTPVLAVEGLHASRQGRPVLHGIHLTLRQGECVALVGANGAGKTTLLRHLNGLSRPAAGRVTVLGHDVRNQKTSTWARWVGMTFQNPDNQFFRLTVRDELAAGPLALGCHDPAWLARLAALFALEPLLDRAPFRLSGGEKRRVAFASALAANPPVLVLDEPTAGQDLPFRRRLAELLGALKNQGRAVLLATHDLPFAAACADRWLLLDEGRVVDEGGPELLAARVGLPASERSPAFSDGRHG